MSNNHKQGQRIRRITERLSQTETVQDIIVDVVADQQQQINALDQRVAEIEKEKTKR
jgi:hypothetical protein